MWVPSVTKATSRGVPLARRLLGAHPIRVAAGAGGIGLALMLILLLDGRVGDLGDIPRVKNLCSDGVSAVSRGED
jgi:hypothetical protein